MRATPNDVEAAIRDALAASDHRAAVEYVLRLYGSEIHGYLRGRFRGDAEHTDEAFAMFSEDLVRGVATVELRSTARAWAYGIARNAGHRFLEREVQRRRAAVPWPDVPEDAEPQAGPGRTPTRPHLKTENKLAIRQLRESLTEEEQTLLTLRVDRGLAWRELAEIFAESTDEPLTTATARLRKRFEAVTKKLRRLAQESGLLEPRTLR